MPTFVPSQSGAILIPPTTIAGGNGPSSGGLALGSTMTNGNQSLIFLVVFILVVASIVFFVVLTLMYRYSKQQSTQTIDKDSADHNISVDDTEDYGNNAEEELENIIESTKFITKKRSSKSARRRSSLVERAMGRTLSFDRHDTADKAFNNPMYLETVPKS